MRAQRQEYRAFSARRLKKKPLAARGDRRPAGSGGKPAIRNGAKVFKERAWAAIVRSLNLSNREQQLVRGVFEDRTDHSIASALGISRHTVHTHFERLHAKLQVTNRAQLILHVLDEFLTLTASPDSGLPPLCPYGTTTRCPWRNGWPPAWKLAVTQAGVLQKR
jgi:DNA-binding CsgD family transcriptional regulator